MINVTLILGTPGSGKSQTGRAIADSHSRKGRDVVLIDANIPVDLSRDRPLFAVPDIQRNVDTVIARDDNAKLLDVILVDSDATYDALGRHSDRFSSIHAIFTSRG